MDLLSWLKKLSLAHHHGKLVENGVDFSLLPQLTEDDLKELGLNLGDRKRFLIGQKELRGEPTEATEPKAPEIVSGAVHERRQLTLMFVDLVGSTALSNSLDLESYRETLNIYQNLCMEAIRERNGFTAQFLGDGVVAYFGYPIADEAAAESAVLAGLKICELIQEATSPAGDALQVRIGISTGDVLIDTLVGSTEINAGLAMGDTPNLAARIQSATKPGAVAISGATRQLLGANFSTRSIGKHNFKGFDQEIEVWVVTGVEDTALRFEARHRKSTTPLINREDELRTLTTRWRETRRGKGQVACLSGEAGIGKSRLVDAVIEQVSAEDAHVIGFQCSPHRDTSAFFPIISLLTFSARMRRSDSNEVKLEKLEQLLCQWTAQSEPAVAILSTLLGLAPADGLESEKLDSEDARRRLLDLLINIVVGLSQQKPLLLVFEDLHWIDPSSEELIERLVERLPAERLMLLCTYRLGYACPWERRARVTTLSIARLDDIQSKALVRHLIRADDELLPAGLEEQIVERTDGVPLFVEEMVRMVRQRLKAPDADEPIELLSLPSTLKDLLRAQIDGMPSARDMIPVCAAIGRMIHPHLLIKVSGLEEAIVKPLLEQLVQAKMLVRHGGSRDRTYSFRHALILDIAYESMLPSRAKALHMRIAEELTGDFSDLAEAAPEILAHHYIKAGVPLAARDAWRDAARLAASRWATKETLSHLNAALQSNSNAETDDKDTVEIELRKMMVVALHHRGFASPAHSENYTRLSELLKKTGGDFDATLPFVTVHNRFGALLMQGEAAEALEMCEEISAVADSSSDHTLRMLAAHNRGMATFFVGEFEASVDAFNTSLTLREEASAEDIFHIYPGDLRLVDGGMRLWARSHFSAVDASMKQDLNDFVEGLADEPHLFSRCYALAVSATTYQTLSDVERTLSVAKAAKEICAETEFDYWSAWCSFLIGWARAMQGETGAGAAEIRAGVKAYLDSGSAQMRLYAETLLADVYLKAGEVDEGLAVIDAIRLCELDMSIRFQKPYTDRVEAALRAASD